MKHARAMRFWDTIWYEPAHPLAYFVCFLLYPFSFILGVLARLRRHCLELFFQKVQDIPVIVVGNISVGGVGKTPLVADIALHCVKNGYRVGIVSRGYGARTRVFPYRVSQEDTPDWVGDEPLWLSCYTRCPVVIAPNRLAAIAMLREDHPIDLIISDDGLQHYRMGRDLEIAVMDGLRGLGNGLCFPAGPLREPPSRLHTVDMVVVNGAGLNQAVDNFSCASTFYAMQMKPTSIYKLMNGEKISSVALQGKPIAAVAGIGNPERFFLTLDTMGMTYTPYVFPDHHRFIPSDLCVAEGIIIMTEKDAVKCRDFAHSNCYVLTVTPELPDVFWHALDERLLALSNQRTQGECVDV